MRERRRHIVRGTATSRTPPAEIDNARHKFFTIRATAATPARGRKKSGNLSNISAPGRLVCGVERQLRLTASHSRVRGNFPSEPEAGVPAMFGRFQYVKSGFTGVET